MNLQNKLLSVTKRQRATPYSRRVEAAGVKAYSVYNHMFVACLVPYRRRRLLALM